jgi:hypothetical protein
MTGKTGALIAVACAAAILAAWAGLNIRVGAAFVILVSFFAAIVIIFVSHRRGGPA